MPQLSLLNKSAFSLYHEKAICDDFKPADRSVIEQKALLSAILSVSDKLGGIVDNGSMGADRWLVTQVLIWSLMADKDGVFFAQNGRICVSESAKLDVESAVKCLINADLRPEEVVGIKTYIDAFYRELDRFYMIPSFAAYSSTHPLGSIVQGHAGEGSHDGLIVLDETCILEDGSRELTVFDTNGVLSRFDFTGLFNKTSGVEILQDNENNSITILYDGKTGFCFEQCDEVKTQIPGSFDLYECDGQFVVTYADGVSELGCSIAVEMADMPFEHAPNYMMARGAISVDEAKNYLEGNNNAMTSIGVTREGILNELYAHEHDNFYLGTRYVGGDWQSPNGDTSYNGSAGMNCGGFVSYVLRKQGMRADEVVKSMTDNIPWLRFGSFKPYDLLAGASNWYHFAAWAGFRCYVFGTKEELLASGKAEKGDIIITYWNLYPFNDGADNHIGFFWGDTPSDDKFWHSSVTHNGNTIAGNQIGPITPKTWGSVFILIKPDDDPDWKPDSMTVPPRPSSTPGPSQTPELPPGKSFIRKTSDNGKNGGITFTISGNGETYHRVTDDYGRIDLSDLPAYIEGTKQLIEYHVEEEIPVESVHSKDNASKSFVLEPGKTVYLDFENITKVWRLTFKKHDSVLSSQAQGKGKLSGAEFGIYRNGELLDIVASDENGVVQTPYYPCGPGYTCIELTPPEGYRLDSTVYAIGLMPGETIEQYNDCNRMEPLDGDDPDVIRKVYELKSRLR